MPAAARRNTPPPLPAAARSGPPAMQRLRTIDNKYLVRGTIGSGGMGVVLEAEHIGIGRVVAIKVLHPHLGGDEVQLKRFMREARTAGMCGHPNVAVVYDAGSLEDGRPYIVMERLYGQSLATRISEGRPMAIDEAIDIVTQTLSALDAVHRSGVVHRDVKPDNIFLVDRTADGAKPRAGAGAFVKVLDFGTSKPMSGPERDLTGTGIAIGTAYYMSPEQARGERDLDGRVDVYAVGVMLYEMLTGARPFSAPSEHGILLKILSDDPQPLSSLRPGLPTELDLVIKKAMARDRELRYQSAEEFISALEALRGVHSEGMSSAPFDERPLPPAAPLPDSVRVPIAREPAVRGEPPADVDPRFAAFDRAPQSHTATGFYEEPTPLHTSAVEIRALARAALAGARALEERQQQHRSLPSEPTIRIDSQDARALAAQSQAIPDSRPAPPASTTSASAPDPASRPRISPTAQTRRVDPPLDEGETIVSEPHATRGASKP